MGSLELSGSKGVELLDESWSCFPELASVFDVDCPFDADPFSFFDSVEREDLR